MLKRASVLLVAACFLFAALGAAIKVASEALPSEEIVFFRNAFGLLALMPLVLRNGFGSLKTKYILQHLYRGVFGLAAMYCSFYAIGRMRLADALLLSYTSPLFMPFFAHFSLGEKIPSGLAWFLSLGFLGVLLILKPGLGLFQPVACLALASGVLAAMALVGIRRLTLTEPTVRIVFYFSLFSTLISAAPLAGRWVSPSAPLWLFLAGMGACASVGQLCLTRAYGLAPASQIGPFIYATVVFAGLWDWFLWGQLPDGLGVLGAACVVAAGVLIIYKIGDAPRSTESVSSRAGTA
ncbi:MAG TPA: DMT family transporter [Elusimicrobiota bacterium]|nr:DMT family transporter [Elusimicrobiota bacterium]